MIRVWNIKVDEIPYTIRLKARSVLINGEKNRLRPLLSKRGFLENQYSVPIGSKQALFIMSNITGKASLVIDGKDCATGEAYVPTKVPAWAYLFIVLHLMNLINGLPGIAIALLGISCTVSISSNARFSLPVRVLLDFIVLVAAFLAILGISYALVMAFDYNSLESLL